MEKKFGGSGWGLFVKANNLLNLPLIQYIRRNSRNEGLTGVERHDGGLLERKKRHGQSLLVGVLLKL